MRGESNHHMLWPRRNYVTKHEKAVRRELIMPMDWDRHCDLHATLQPPEKPDTGILLCIIDYLHEKQPTREDAPLYAIDRLVKLRSEEALNLADHFSRQLGYLGLRNE